MVHTMISDGTPQVIAYNTPKQKDSDQNSDKVVNFPGDMKKNKVSPVSAKKTKVFVDISDGPKKHFQVLWHNLSCTVPLFTVNNLASLKSMEDLKRLMNRQKNILNNLNGFFHSGEVTGIMGPSGAGKSTLLEIICGRRRRGVVGQVKIRGADNIRVGFVPQDNHLMELLTVKESFVFASKVINVNDKNFDHNSLTDKLITRFGLDLITDTQARRCSGGQRKRLSIALEVISKPNILILDEPTTGLDSPSCTHVIAIMKELVSDKQHPTAVVATIHQPSVSNFNAFGSVYVLSSRGYLLYHGTPANLVPTFTRLHIKVHPYTSPADYVIEVAAADYGEGPINKMIADAEEQVMKKLVITDTKLLEDASYAVRHPFWPHFKLLFQRSQVMIYRDPSLIYLRVLIAVLSALVLNSLFGPDVGLVSGCFPRALELYTVSPSKLKDKFVDDLYKLMHNCALMFCGIMIGFLSGITPTLLTFPAEMLVFHKEYHNGWYSCITYYLSKVFSDIPMQIATPLLYILLTYFYSNQPLEVMRFTMLLLLSILLSFSAQSIGECGGAIFMGNPMAAVIFAGFVPLPMILFGGFLVRIKRMPSYMQPMSWVSFMRYALEVALISLYGFGRCEYQYQRFLSSVNVSAIKKPLWAESLSLMVDFVNNKKGIDVMEEESSPDQSEDDSLSKVYNVFLGTSISGGSSIDLDTSLLLTYYDLEDWMMYRGIALIIFFMVALKFITYFVMLAKLKSTK